MNLCHECSTENRRWAVGLVTATLILGIFVAVLVVFHILKEAEDGAESACPQPILSCHNWLQKAVPISAIKIVVVVLQIITQVGVVVVDPRKRVTINDINGILMPTYMW